MKITKRQLRRIIKEEKAELSEYGGAGGAYANADKMQGTYSDISMIAAVTKSIQALSAQTEADAYDDLGDDEDASRSAMAAVVLTVAQAFEAEGYIAQYHALIKTLQ